MEGRARAFLSRHDIEDPSGERVDLGQVAEAAAEARRAQWYSIVLGLQERARKDGFVHLFISCTLPTEWHPNPVSGDRSGYDHHLSPSAGARELSKTWHNTMAMMVQRNARYYGVRVPEPHKDGCPHFHAGLWIHPDDVDSVIECFASHFPASNDDEEKARAVDDYAEGPALVIKRWTEDGGASAASYVMHYILKCLAGAEDDGQSLAARTWASDIGIRRISLVGLSAGTVGRWRAAYRMMKAGSESECPAVQAAIHALRRGQWSSALNHVGAFDRTAFRTVRGERLDRWGDLVKFTGGWIARGQTEMGLVARLKAWVIVEKDALSVVDSYPRQPPAAAAGPPAAMISRPERWRWQPGKLALAL
jgi:hypothetical protein